ncbi:lytic transglycosylase domain-containing protein [Microvirga sp. ACRRW]|uniref:lytic transglycosylase domain-containing protein n=1 Tax=Microvirga sp. ACRRW TaxID=2918205 RepID=UPI001EF4EFDB|nr:lytic transglycosylase domain-containing protein [Microvirga sp. ACRRW]MCG7391712.1 lytic transglycosylase domain-containing protein [Microvirga sp. ACRRW]
MTWQHFSRTLAVAILGVAALALASQARADNVISPDEAEALMRAQIEETKAAAAAQKEEESAIQAEEAAEAAKAAKSGKKKIKEAAAATPSPATAKAAATAAKETTGEDAADETASLVIEPQGRSRSERADAVKASALKPLIARYAAENGLSYELADAVVRIESRYNPGARNGPNIGLTQINYRTAQSLGYKGDVAGLMDAETNLRYGLKYLAQAHKLAGGDTCGTILRYQFGHRTTTMTSASRAYCARVKVITAAAD